MPPEQDEPQGDVPWEGKALTAAWEFGKRCRALSDEYPYGEASAALDWIVHTMATELWDQFFSQTEIRAAFDKAIADLPHYAAGEDRRT